MKDSQSWLVCFGVSILIHSVLLFVLQPPLQGALRAGTGSIEVLLSMTRGKTGDPKAVVNEQTTASQQQMASAHPRNARRIQAQANLPVHELGMSQIDGADVETRSGGAQPQAEFNYFAQVKDWLERHKRYPLQARKYRQQGTVVLHFTMDAQGNVLSHAIGKSSGYFALDHEVEDLLQRASPFPSPPQDLQLSGIELVVPISFDLR